MYKVPVYNKSKMKSVELVEGETIEQKIERIVNNNEPITDGAPEIFTERKDGVISAYNIRTDRWEIACEAMDKVQGSVQARRDAKAKAVEENALKEADGKEVSGAESIQGETESK